MSHRSRRYRKRFPCGHRGFGQYCHRCHDRQRQRVQAEAQTLPTVSVIHKKQTLKHRHRATNAHDRQIWNASFAHDPVELRSLPTHIVRKARQVLSALNQGTGYWEMAGKRLTGMREIIRIPVTYRYRLLCRDNGQSLQPLKVMSHEEYNSVAKRPRHYFASPPTCTKG